MGRRPYWPRRKLARRDRFQRHPGQREIARGWFGSEAGTAGFRVATGHELTARDLPTPSKSTFETGYEIRIQRPTPTLSAHLETTAFLLRRLQF